MKILALKFNKEKLQEQLKYLTTTTLIFYTEDIDKIIPSREIILLAKKALSDTSLVIVDLLESELTIDEIFLIQLAYTNSTPIYVVSVNDISSRFLAEVITRRFTSLPELVDHISSLCSIL